jgi:hypothetical protein
MIKNKYTPMQEVMFQLETSKYSIEFVVWMQNNIARLVYEEKYLVIDAYDEGNDPYRMFRDPDENMTKGQEFFLNNFINI